MPIDEYPINDTSLSLDYPLSSDVARSLVQNCIHIYRDRLQPILTLAPTEAGGGHTELYSTASDYEVVLTSTHRVSPWSTRWKVYAHLVNNGTAAARCRVGFIFNQGVRASIEIPTADGDWDVGGFYDGLHNLPLTKLNSNVISANPTVTIRVWCKKDCEVYALSIWEEHA